MAPASKDSLISIIIPTYNYARYLPGTLESIYRQTEKGYEVVVVDDGSTDDSGLVVESYRDRLPRLIHVVQRNQGPAAARNHGIRLSQGRYLLFLDSDDQLALDAIAHFCSTLRRRGEPDFVFGRHRRTRSDATAKVFAHKPLSRNREDNFRRYLLGDLRSIEIGAGIIKREVFSRLMFPEPIRNREDVVLLAQMLARHDGLAVPEIVATKHRHRDSRSHDQRATREERLKTIELLFDPALLPDGALRFRNRYHSLRCLSQFRSLYKAGKYAEARSTFEEAIALFPGHLARLSHLTRYLRMVLGPAPDGAGESLARKR